MAVFPINEGGGKNDSDTKPRNAKPERRVVDRRPTDAIKADANDYTHRESQESPQFFYGRLGVPVHRIKTEGDERSEHRPIFHFHVDHRHCTHAAKRLTKPKNTTMSGTFCFVSTFGLFNPQALLGQAIIDAIRNVVEEAIRKAAAANGHPTELLTAEELADKIKVPLSWVYEQSGQNNIPNHRIGRYIRFDLQEVIASQKVNR